jgi:hypothetical protein
MFRPKNTVLSLLSVASLGFGPAISGSQIAAPTITPTATTPASVTATLSFPGEHVAPRRIVTGVPSAKQPVGVITLYYDDKQLVDRVPFNAPDDWLKHISIQVRNKGMKPLIAGVFQLTLPDLGVAPMIFDNARFGMTPEHQLYATSTGAKVPRPKGEVAASIAPNQYVKISLAKNYEVLRAKMEAAGVPLSKATVLVVDYGPQYYEGDLRWQPNTFRRADPSRPGQYIPTNPDDFKAPPASSTN